MVRRPAPDDPEPPPPGGAAVPAARLEERRYPGGRVLLRPECIEATTTWVDTALPDDWQGWGFLAPAAGWWSNGLGVWPSVPRDTFLGAGVDHQILAVVPGLELVIVRPGPLYGRGDRVLLPALRKVLRAPVLPEVQLRIPSVHAGDAARAIVQACTRPVAGRSYNLTGPPHDLQDLVRAWAAVMESRMPCAEGFTTMSS